MRKKSPTYYLNTLVLKARALKHRVLSNTTAYQKKAEALKVYNLTQLTDANLSFDQNKDDLYYYSYGHFQHPEDLASSLLFDDQGVPINSVGNSFRDYVNPLFPAYFGLVCFNHYLQSGAQSSLKKFATQVNYLSQVGVWYGESLEYHYSFDYPAFGLKAPWKAGITQALIASLFYRAYTLEKKAEYLTMMKASLDCLFKPVDQGGLFCQTPEGLPWIEEYPSQPPSLVLNGFIFCIVAIVEYAQVSDDRLYKTRAKDLIESLVTNLHHYQYGHYLRHNRKFWALSNLEYQGLYVFQFIHLYRLTNIDFFKELALTLEKAFSWNDFFYFYQMDRQVMDINKYFKADP